MIKKIEMVNYKSFKNTTIDFCSNNKPKQNIFIYGENGSGKSNIISAFSFLRTTMTTLTIHNRLDEMLKNNEDIDVKQLKYIINNHKNALATTVKSSKMIDCHNGTKLKYTFLIDHKEAEYTMEFKNDLITYEQLKYPLDKYKTVMYAATPDSLQLHDKLIKSSKYKDDLSSLHKQYFGNHTFLAILSNEYFNKNPQFINVEFPKNFIKIFMYLFHISIFYKDSVESGDYFVTGNSLLQDLHEGTVTQSSIKQLKVTESILNEFFTNLYSDIKNVFYETKTSKEKVKYKLYFKKMISGELRNIPHDIESTGTLQILKILPYLLSAIQGNVVLIDEIDSNVHDIMIKAIIEAVDDNLKGQIIATTHNTTLIDVLKHQNVYVIDINSKGDKEVHPLHKAGTQIHQNHNVKDRYLSGLYGGVPFTGYLDMANIVKKLSDTEESKD